MPAPSARTPMDRRTFIRRAGVGLAGTAVAAIPGMALAKAQRKVYRLSTRGQVCCNACRGHGANRYYFNWSTANGDRPHIACNCRILEQWIPKSTHDAYFGNGLTQRKIFDERRR